MGSKSDPTSLDRWMRAMFTARPENQPEWAKKAWAARAELERTGKRITVPEHFDNTGASCRNVGSAALVYDVNGHDCCHVCNDLGERELGKESTA